TGWTFHFDIDATPDMFDLFRKTALPGEINPGYWSEKVRAGREDGEADRGPVWLWAKKRRGGGNTEPAALPVDGYANPVQVA
ncbi:hypothetical protein KBZ21_41020, partial [Streptomyces sp. A73]|nr:hypothetical protein [Streptomyces sp. A73]